MKALTILQDIQLWEAWVEFDHFSTANFGTLYVLGEFPVSGKAIGGITRKGVEGKCLVLELPVQNGNGREKMTEMLYSESIQLDQYTSIIVMQGNEVIVEIDEIEVLV